jgi:hypothetical protein
MSYTKDDLVLFEPVFDASQRDGTAYFEFHQAELPEENACWLPGSLLLRDAAFDFFVECFYRASKTFDYFSFVRFGTEEISSVVDDLNAYVGVLERDPSRDELFANYGSMFSADIWSEVPTGELTDAVHRTGISLNEFIRSTTPDTGCLWILGM